jgi:hypothetical protein
MKIAKATNEDMDKTRGFLQTCESIWDNRNRFSFRLSEREWESWDEDDPDYLECLKIRKEISLEEDFEEKHVDGRLVMYEFIMRKYKKADCHWNRVIMAADVLIDNCCDPTEDHLEFYPGFELFHVANEQ